MFEYAFVSVPLDRHACKLRLNDAKNEPIYAKKVIDVAERMGSDPTVLWMLEGEPLIELHPWLSVHPSTASDEPSRHSTTGMEGIRSEIDKVTLASKRLIQEHQKLTKRYDELRAHYEALLREKNGKLN